MNENIKEIMNEFDKINIVLPSQSELARCGYGVFNKDNETKIFDYNEFAKQYIATALHKAGYRKQSETVKEFAGKLLSPLIKAYNQSYKASGYDMEAARSASEIKHYIDYIKQTAEQYGKEEKE